MHGPGSAGWSFLAPPAEGTLGAMEREPTPSATADEEIRIGISACLLGEEVRFDGGHKRARFLTDTVAEFVRYVPVCPELELGLGVPRESLRLSREAGGVRLVAPKSGTDHTDSMGRFAERRARELGSEDLDGFVLKKDSPSCGLFRVKIYDQHGSPSRDGRGLFAEAMVANHAHLPMEEEGRLNDPGLRENFFERVFAYRRLKNFFAGTWKVGQLVEFHTREKFLLFAHDEPAYRELGRLVAEAKSRSREALEEEYRARFMQALGKLATRRQLVNVLQHITGFFKRDLDDESRRELAEVIEDFRAGLLPLVVPVTLVRHHVRILKVEYLAGQTFLEPHPKELMLRNHV